MKLYVHFAFSLMTTFFLISTGCSNTEKSQIQKAPKETAITKKEVTKSASQTYPTEVILEAAFNGKTQIVNEAINGGYDANAIGANNRTALMLASFNGHTEIVKTLLEAGANVSMRDDVNRTALMFASTGPFLETVELLLDAGSEVNAFDGVEHFTPLMFAASEGQYDIVKKLLDRGAEKTMLDIDGESAYDFAISNRHPKVAALVK